MKKMRAGVRQHNSGWLCLNDKIKGAPQVEATRDDVQICKQKLCEKDFLTDWTVKSLSCRKENLQK